MCGSTGSRTKAPTMSPRRSWRRRMFTRSARRATNWRRTSMSTADLLKRAPNLLLVSSNGAGFDPVDVDACTAAGVVVVNQSGGNANSVAEHAVGMMLTLSKRIIEADRALRRERQRQSQRADGQRSPGQDHRHRRPRQCRPPHRRTMPRPVAHERAGLRSLSVGDRDGGTRRREGRTRRSAAPFRLRLDLLSADKGQSRHDRRCAIRADAEARLFHHHRARLHS